MDYSVPPPRSMYVTRKDQPAISLYFIRDDNSFQPHKLSCPFCKRTIMDGVKGRIDKMVDGPVDAHDHDFACNIQCKLCGQKFRILVNANFPIDLQTLIDAAPPTSDEMAGRIGDNR